MKWTYYVGWRFFRLVFRWYFRTRARGMEHVPAQGPVILAANHASFLDPPLVGAFLPRDIHYLARESLFRFPLFGAVLRSVNVVPVDRDGSGAAGLRRILNRLLGGAGIVLFPEGTRTRDGRLQPARGGVSLLVLKSAAPVVPVRIFGSFEAYGRHHWFPRPKPLAVIFGAPLDFEALRQEARQCDKERQKRIYQEVSERVMAAIAALEP